LAWKRCPVSLAVSGTKESVSPPIHEDLGRIADRFLVLITDPLGTDLAVPDRLVETSREASLRSVFPVATGWPSEQHGDSFDFAQDLSSSSVIAVQDGRLVAEWGVTDKRISAHSVRKSIVSALYGIAVERGLIDTLKTLQELGIDDQRT
jgi:hypothetical protein